MTIRAANTGDLVKLEPLAKVFYASSAVLNRPFDIDRFIALWTRFIEAGEGVVLLADTDDGPVGALGGIRHQETYSDAQIASEFFWFVLPEHRGCGIKLYKAFEQWAKDQGCKEIRMVHLIDLMPQQVATTYMRLGFAPVEVAYAKGLA